MHMQIWWRLTEFGDSAILLPVALVIALWLLIMPATRRSGWSWLAAVLINAAVVAVSKIVYMAWGVHPPGLNFTGLSGDSAMVFLFWPAAGAYLTGRARPSRRWLLIGAGVALAVIVAVSRVVLRAHSVSEVVVGSVWGALVAAIFLWAVWRQPSVTPASGVWLPLTALILVLLVSVRHFDFNRVLTWGALKLSGHTMIYTRCDLGAQNTLAEVAAPCRAVGPATNGRRRSHTEGL